VVVHWHRTLPFGMRKSLTGEEQLAADFESHALYVVIDALTPAERVSFVLHGVFEIPFDAIAAVLGRSTPAAKMLATRARTRIRLGTPATAAGPVRVERDTARSGTSSPGCVCTVN
jgi:RNA polymerase sigma-70 factor (ECF subfamily)